MCTSQTHVHKETHTHTVYIRWGVGGGGGLELKPSTGTLTKNTRKTDTRLVSFNLTLLVHCISSVKLVSLQAASLHAD